MRCDVPLIYPCSPLNANATKPSLNEIGLTVAELRTFQDIAYKHRPLMNMNEIGTKTIGTVYSLWVIYQPSMRMVGPCVDDLELSRAINRKYRVNPASHEY